MTKDFVIATFNLENLDDKGKFWLKRKEALKPMLKRINADLLFLQEVNSLSALDDLIKDTIYEDFNKAYTTDKKGKPYDERNLIILTQKRYTIRKKEQYHHNLVHNSEWKQVTAKKEAKGAEKVSWERPILHCEIALKGSRVLHAINLHLKSKIPTDIKGQKKDRYTWLSHEGWAEGFFLSSIKRVGQAFEVRMLLEKIFTDESQQAIIAIGGDFNAEIGSVPFEIIVGSVENTNNPDLRNTVMVPCEYNVPLDQRYSLIHHGKGEMLDHAIVSQALYPYWVETVIFNEILQDKSIPFATEEKFPESDHAPVATRFRLPDDWLP